MNVNSGVQFPVQAIVFDWAGTLADFGSLAPVASFHSVFEDEGIDITFDEARCPMGLAKREHIACLTHEPRIRDAWIEAKGTPPTEADNDRMYASFIPRQIDAIRKHAEPIPEVLELFRALRDRGTRIGLCTGYNRPMLQELLASTRDHGLVVDYAVCSDDVRSGRPAPDMALSALERLGKTDTARRAKVDDTTPGILEGLAAGMWTVGLMISGNEVGLSHQDWSALPTSEQERMKDAAAEVHRRVGTHFVIDSAADLLPVLDTVTTRLGEGQQL